jgi:hypothetical protein
MKAKLRHFYLFFRSFFPQQIPKGVTSFKAWADDVILLAGPEIPNNRSTQFAVATMTMHLGPSKDAIPMRELVKKLRKAASNEVAYSILENMKKEQDAAVKVKQDSLLAVPQTDQQLVGVGGAQQKS